MSYPRRRAAVVPQAEAMIPKEPPVPTVEAFYAANVEECGVVRTIRCDTGEVLYVWPPSDGGPL